MGMAVRMTVLLTKTLAGRCATRVPAALRPIGACPDSAPDQRTASRHSRYLPRIARL
jgi:hypothetical protein